MRSFVNNGLLTFAYGWPKKIPGSDNVLDIQTTISASIAIVGAVGVE